MYRKGVMAKGYRGRKELLEKELVVRLSRWYADQPVGGTHGNETGKRTRQNNISMKGKGAVRGLGKRRDKLKDYLSLLG